MLAKGKMCFGIKQSGCNKAAADKSLQSASIYAAISKKENNPTILEPRRIKRKSSRVAADAFINKAMHT